MSESGGGVGVGRSTAVPTLVRLESAARPLLEDQRHRQNTWDIMFGSGCSSGCPGSSVVPWVQMWEKIHQKIILPWDGGPPTHTVRHRREVQVATVSFVRLIISISRSNLWQPIRLMKLSSSGDVVPHSLVSIHLSHRHSLEGLPGQSRTS